MQNNQLREYFSKKEFRIQLIAVVLFLLTSCLVLFLLQKKERINLLDSNEYQVETFTDAADQGKSSSTIISRTKEELTVKCCLEKGFQYPYAGIQIRKRDSTFYSLKDYTLEMELASQKKQRLPIRMYNFQQGISDSTNSNALVNLFVLYQNVYIIEKGDNALTIPFNSFKTIPEWWYTRNNMNESDVKSWDIDHVARVSIFSDPGYPIGEERIFKITKLTLVGDYSGLYKMLVAFILCVLILFFAVQVVLYQKQKRIQVTLTYSDGFDFETERADLKSQIHAYISEHYSNSELKSVDLANHLNIPEYKIGELLKDNVGMTFKSFLNHTRIEAAKLYLKNSSYSISEIAYKTGFNSPSSFNRVFKELVKQAPGEFKN